METAIWSGIGGPDRVACYDFVGAWTTESARTSESVS
jgi:hypothetical protein